MIAGFILAHFCLLLILLGLILPRYYNIFIPRNRRSEGTETTVPLQPRLSNLPPDYDTLDIPPNVSSSGVGSKDKGKATDISSSTNKNLNA